MLPVWGLVHPPVRALARQASPRLAVAVAAVERSACRSPVAPVVLEVPVALACLSVRDHPVVAVATGHQPAVPLVPLHPLAVPVAQAEVVAVRICCSCHGSRVARRRAPGWLTVAG